MSVLSAWSACEGLGAREGRELCYSNTSVRCKVLADQILLSVKFMIDFDTDSNRWAAHGVAAQAAPAPPSPIGGSGRSASSRFCSTAGEYARFRLSLQRRRRFAGPLVGNQVLRLDAVPMEHHKLTEAFQPTQEVIIRQAFNLRQVGAAQSISCGGL